MSLTQRGREYRYLELPEPDYGRFQRGLRWALLIAGVLWVVIFTIGAIVTAAVTGGSP